MLLSGIKIVADAYIDKSDISINNGVVPALGYDIYDEMGYKKEAFKPRNNWRQPTEQEYSLILSNRKNESFTSNIALKKLPQEIISLFKKVDIDKCRTRKEVYDRFRQKISVTQLLNRRLESFISKKTNGKDYIFHIVAVTKPNLETTAFDDDTREYLGLHIDRSSGLPINQMANSRNRICINIGLGNRYLYLINLTLDQIVTMLHNNCRIHPNVVNLDNIVSLFFNFFPTYPIVRICQRQYMYYTAPTDNFIHDGSSLDNIHQDISVHYLGYFDLY